MVHFRDLSVRGMDPVRIRAIRDNINSFLHHPWSREYAAILAECLFPVEEGSPRFVLALAGSRGNRLGSLRLQVEDNSATEVFVRGHGGTEGEILRE